LYSAWVNLDGDLPASGLPDAPTFPLLALIVSGGHTELVLMKDHLDYQRLGATLDDAAGEAFDKISRLLGLTYPGGPAIQKAALDGNPTAFEFPRAWLEDSWDFSFSGLKTAVLHKVREFAGRELPVADLAVSFQAAVVEVLVEKTKKAAREFSAKEILVTGGVSANQALREAFATSTMPVHFPPLPLCTDNAAMIAAAGYFRHAIIGEADSMDIDIEPGWEL
jgi:N6-L-threonylcarbamoyladenine synthase